MKSKQYLKIIIPIIIILLWFALIFYLSSMTSKMSNESSIDIIGNVIKHTVNFITDGKFKMSADDIEITATMINPILRKVMHASEYLVLALLIVLFLKLNIKNIKYFSILLITILLCFTFASCDEYHQTFVEGRTGQFKDVLIDSTGSLCGILLYGTYYLAYSNGHKKGIKERIGVKNGKRKKEIKN